jgi:hypothetical protein
LAWLPDYANQLFEILLNSVDARIAVAFGFVLLPLAGGSPDRSFPRHVYSNWQRGPFAARFGLHCNLS